MSRHTRPRVVDVVRYDSQAQWATLLSFLAVLVPVSFLITGDDAALPLTSLICLVLLVIGLAWLVTRVRRIRHAFATGERLDATVVELRPSLGDRRAIVFEYTAAGQAQRSKYHLGSRLLPSLRSGSTLRLVVDPNRPSRPHFRDLYE